jgi:exo-beta-1,3-glucanase (GH17 family)/cellulose synthase/poly-beta-1,6-N-acetylglucosamine synthase-like glycosyltransferase
MRKLATILGIVACVHAMIWMLDNRRETPPAIAGKLASLSYNRFAGAPSARRRVSEAQIRSDLATIAPLARAVRTYSSTRGLQAVPRLAAEYGLNVTLGIWIGRDAARNEREIASALRLARENPNVLRLVVGNETVYRHERTPEELGRIIDRVRSESPVPVTTAENWHVFVVHPDLAKHVDSIFAHIIPYWEGLSERKAVDGSFNMYDILRRQFPDKSIVVGEFGWPSAGNNFKRAVPSPIGQAAILRGFIARAAAVGIDYNIVEAFDQPKKLFEGSVGPYWGMLDASGRPKFVWSGPVFNQDHGRTAVIAVLVGLVLSLPVLALARMTVVEAAVLAAAAHGIGAWSATVLAYWHARYFMSGEAVAFGFGVPLLGTLLVVALSRIQELAAVAFGLKPRYLLARPVATSRPFAPKVSIHIAAYREPPEMLLQTLDAVARLNYPNFECIVVINNTPDPAFWEPIAARCLDLGSRFKFVRVENLRGFKAGALRVAAAHTAPDAEIIGVIDADYVVHPDWLKDLIPSFADAAVGLVQAPQDHRDGGRSLLHAAMNAEYAGFFDIGMVERNEANAIIMHGTMCLIRRAALEEAGGWSSDTICEDTDLGLAILERGWRAHYTTTRYGWGLLPQDYAAFKAQRHRWATGGVQIIKKHWRSLLPGSHRLDVAQRREFALGWLGWVGAETAGVAAAFLNLLWVPFIAVGLVAIPEAVLTAPVVAVSIISLLHFLFAYQLRVLGPLWQRIAALFVFMSVQWTIARAAAGAVIHGRRKFYRTPKGSLSPEPSIHFPATAEAVFGCLLLGGAILLFGTNINRVFAIDLFASVLVLQSLPFLSAVGLAVLEGTRANRVEFWRRFRIGKYLVRSLPSAQSGSSLRLPE